MAIGAEKEGTVAEKEVDGAKCVIPPGALRNVYSKWLRHLVHVTGSVGNRTTRHVGLT